MTDLLFAIYLTDDHTETLVRIFYKFNLKHYG